ncbi:unnamed protein product [Durusdinium trenchii]|uniref:E3 ubiquitin-protein ligase RNF115 (RING finger protein 115) (RING-type E3 ubiquitin transferase RNF115) (Rabring 7) (Zinc finger protein 364) n=2 Tax=Durusdinium trenchii TaxID=1381693 RepID=A0ABP0NKU7_9DINO
MTSPVNSSMRAYSAEMPSYGQLSHLSYLAGQSPSRRISAGTQTREIPQVDDESASSEESDDGLGPLPLAHRVSAQVLGWGAAVSQHRRSSAEDLVRQGMSQAQANAEVVAQHREEILYELFSRYVLVIGMFSLVLSAALLGLATWHILEYVKYHDVVCEGSLKLLTKIILGISFFDIVMGTRVCCIEIDETSVPSRWRCKDCCVVLLLCVMAINVWILLWLGAASKRGNIDPYDPTMDVYHLPSCREKAPGLWDATVAHGIGLVTYTIYLMVSFVGVGNMLGAMLRRGLLRSRGAAPVGCLEDSTVPVVEVEEDYECPICLEEVDEESGVMTKECHHIFHRQCLKHWLQVNSTCPLCRLSLARH